MYTYFLITNYDKYRHIQLELCKLPTNGFLYLHAGTLRTLVQGTLRTLVQGMLRTLVHCTAPYYSCNI